MKTLILFLVLSAFAGFGFSQQPDRWHGLIIDESTPEQAAAVLGPPNGDKVDRIFIMNPKWLTKDAGRSLRILKYENVEGFSHVRLGFDKNSKLVLIHIEPKKIAAQAFIGSYDGLSFRFANEVMSPSDLESPRDNLEKPQNLGSSYVLVAANKKVFVFGGVGNATGSVMSGLFGNATSRQSGRSVPGNVQVIQLVSRTLENKDNVDILK